mmetsp:Transcript_8458/g.52885  ORF Transcript_8458/g.52885 Transcript_8458/m.52885 type:complete len:229 (+) Transcript_8458:1078-1764(+)
MDKLIDSKFAHSLVSSFPSWKSSSRIISSAGLSAQVSSCFTSYGASLKLSGEISAPRTILPSCEAGKQQMRISLRSSTGGTGKNFVNPPSTHTLPRKFVTMFLSMKSGTCEEVKSAEMRSSLDSNVFTRHERMTGVICVIPTNVFPDARIWMSSGSSSSKKLRSTSRSLYRVPPTRQSRTSSLHAKNTSSVLSPLAFTAAINAPAELPATGVFSSTYPKVRSSSSTPM